MGFHTITLLMLGTSLLLCGCTGADAPASNDRPIATQVPTGKPVPASPPSAEPAEATVTRSLPSSWDQQVRLMPREHAAYLEGIKQRYFGAVAYGNEQERRELEEAGFPTIEEWMHARTMSDSQLQQQAAMGDGKAMAFYMDRMIERATPYLHLRGTDDTAYDASPAASYVLQAYQYAPQLRVAHRSSFTGYLLGATYSTLSYPPSPEAAAAGIMAAGDAGDPRAGALLLAYQAKHPGMNQDLIQSALRIMKIAR